MPQIVESVNGSASGWQLRPSPSEIRLSEIIRMVDGPLALFGDADRLRNLVSRDANHCEFYQGLLEVRDAAAAIPENTTIADLISGGNAPHFKIRNRQAPKRLLKRR